MSNISLFHYIVIPTISFSTENVIVGESDGTAEVCLNLSVPLSMDLEVTVSFTAGSGETQFSTLSVSNDLKPTAESGIDYIENPPHIASFIPGSTMACVMVQIEDDSIAEEDEMFTATFETLLGLTSAEPLEAKITIVDNDGRQRERFKTLFCMLFYSQYQGQCSSSQCTLYQRMIQAVFHCVLISV